jgi:hypothetical protein
LYLADARENEGAPESKAKGEADMWTSERRAGRFCDFFELRHQS